MFKEDNTTVLKNQALAQIWLFSCSSQSETFLIPQKLWNGYIVLAMKNIIKQSFKRIMRSLGLSSSG